MLDNLNRMWSVFFASPLQMRETPLHVASAKNDVDVLKFLLDWTGPEMIELEARNTVHHHNVQACDLFNSFCILNYQICIWQFL
jgi:hypothetical protein